MSAALTIVITIIVLIVIALAVITMTSSSVSNVDNISEGNTKTAACGICIASKCVGITPGDTVDCESCDPTTVTCYPTDEEE
ncbi:MAG: hypothetical protein KAI53_00330 [Candidatus Aenigmarchaeota archaeon]|nr:hypothetical protein [Candidatus Aenigmarchaeota archaeon]